MYVRCEMVLLRNCYMSSTCLLPGLIVVEYGDGTVIWLVLLQRAPKVIIPFPVYMTLHCGMSPSTAALCFFVGQQH